MRLDEYLDSLDIYPSIEEQMDKFLRIDRDKFDSLPWYKRIFKIHPSKDNFIWALYRLADTKVSERPTLEKYDEWRKGKNGN